MARAEARPGALGNLYWAPGQALRYIGHVSTVSADSCELPTARPGVRQLGLVVSRPWAPLRRGERVPSRICPREHGIYIQVGAVEVGSRCRHCCAGLGPSHSGFPHGLAHKKLLSTSAGISCGLGSGVSVASRAKRQPPVKRKRKRKPWRAYFPNAYRIRASVASNLNSIIQGEHGCHVPARYLCWMLACMHVIYKLVSSIWGLWSAAV